MTASPRLNNENWYCSLQRDIDIRPRIKRRIPEPGDLSTMPPLAVNTLHFGDNLYVLRTQIPDESIDLIYLDPPFNSNRNYFVLFKDRSGKTSTAQDKASLLGYKAQQVKKTGEQKTLFVEETD